MRRLVLSERHRRGLQTLSIRQSSFCLYPDILRSNHSKMVHHRSIHATVALSSQETESEFQVSGTKSIHKSGFVIHPDLKPYIRAPSCSDDHLISLDSGFTITFLGTGASLSPFRSQTSSALRMGGKTFIFDAGDGIQRQLMLSRVNIGEIEKIFSKSHVHSGE